ncbi:MAG: hypothetical protein ACFFBD_05270 [Candidatus Hodarchaeota archaeon]
MSKTETIIEKWIDLKFDAKTVASLTKKGNFHNISISLINGRQYDTKLGSAMSAQLDQGSAEEFIKVLQEILDKFKELVPPKKEEE